jgi:hypothetical protein
MIRDLGSTSGTSPGNIGSFFATSGSSPTPKAKSSRVPASIRPAIAFLAARILLKIEKVQPSALVCPEEKQYPDHRDIAVRLGGMA